MSSHKTRIITAIVLAVLLIYILFLAPYYLLATAIYIFSALGLWEFYSLFPTSRDNTLKTVGIVLSLPIVLFSYLHIDVALGLLLAFWLLNLVYLVYYKMDTQINWRELQIITSGWLYIPLALQFLLRLGSLEILFVFAAAIFSDIGAYYFGSWWGKRKLWPELSPKKTWMGSLGGMLGCVAVLTLWGAIWGAVCWYNFLWIGVLLNLAAQLGDLLISAIKRQSQVKDTGNILPGHGGILDRFDSVLFVIVAYMLINNFGIVF